MHAHLRNAPRRFVALVCAALFFLLTIAVLWGQTNSSVPRLVHYSAVAKDPQGSPLTGTVNITFSLYQNQQGGSPLWQETQSVQPDVHGRYSVNLGATQPLGLPTDLFLSGDPRWLGVQMEGQPEGSRVLLLSVPYALKAGDAETVGGLPPSAFVLATPGSSASGNNAPVSLSAGSPASGAQPLLGGSGSPNFVPLWTPDGNTLGNSVLFQSGSGATVKVGVGTTTPASTLDVKGTSTFRGALTLPATGPATAAAGKNSQAFKLSASAFNSGSNLAVNQNFAWQAEPVNNNSDSASGSLNLLFNSGNGNPQETGLKISNTGVFTFSPSQTFPGAGTINGVTAGPGLTGGGTNGNVTLALTGSCGLGQILQWNTLTWICSNVVTNVTPGTDLIETGAIGNITLSVDTTQVPQLNTGNLFTGNQTVNGNLTATGVVTGNSFQIGSNLFAFGSYANSNSFLGFSGNTTTTATSNTANGYLALSAITSGGFNTASGWEALTSNTTGVANTATGVSSLLSNTTGSFNLADGQLALFFNTTGASNTASGSDALPHNTTGSYNTASGSTALYSSTTGNGNTAIGDGALFNNNTGSNNTALGFLAGPDTAHTNLVNSAAIGSNAQVTASNALVLGSINGINGATASANVGIGTTAPAFTLDVHGTGNFTGPITFAAGQTFPGAGTITGVTAGTDLVGGGASGSVTLNVDTTKVVTGVAAGTDLIGGGTGGTPTLSLDTTKVPQLAAANLFNGDQTMNGNLTATGVVTGSSYQIGSTLFAFGSSTAFNAFLGFAGNTTTTGARNTASGYHGLSADTTGSFNTASGVLSLRNNTTGNDNTASGEEALSNNTTGNDNTATGMVALLGNTTGNDNTASGREALERNSTGNDNTADGFAALFFNTTGSNNTALGFLAGPDIAHANLTNTTAIGANAEVTASNALVLGSINGVNGATADALVGVGITSPTYKLHVGNFINSFRVEGPATGGTSGLAASFGGFGDFGIDAPGIVSGRFVVKESGSVGVGTPSPDALLSVNGSADKPGGGSWGTFSDGRLKNLHGEFSAGLSQILKLQPIRYSYKKENAMGINDSSEHIGFVAQDVQKVIPEAVTQNDKGYLLVNNDPILWTMLNAIKEQQRQIAALRAQLRKREIRQAALESRLARVEHNQGNGTLVGLR